MITQIENGNLTAPFRMTDLNQPPDLIDRLRLGDNEAFRYLYEQYYKNAALYIQSNSGTEQDARDVFQEALLVLFKQTRRAEFRLTTNLGAYLYAVVRKMWLYRLRTQRGHPETSLDESTWLPGPDDHEFDIRLHEQTLEKKHQVIQQLIETMKPECRKLIEYAYFYQLSPVEIAGLLGYAESFVKVKKHRCMEALRKMVTRHPIFNHEP
jgi:RNA polymerase sigma factor (sigma-70 family)